MKPRLIAFYLPQYHPIPENDEWWGKGFTEWTNVAKAKPLFKGHYQPHLPADLGFYDLRVPEVREQQAELAREAGIEGFCYWHYWFGGKQLLERPFNEVLASGKPDFPFCLGWANDSWTGKWYGAPNKILMEQTYPGKEDHIAHFNHLLPAFRDPRYIRVDDKPLFHIFRPDKLPNQKETLELWNELAKSAGLKGLFFTSQAADIGDGEKLAQIGFDALTIFDFFPISGSNNNYLRKGLRKLLGRKNATRLFGVFTRNPYYSNDYKDMSTRIIISQQTPFEYFPGVMPNWDNTPRSGLDGYVITNSSPELFKVLVRQAINRVKDYPQEHQLIFIKSWNEWAEGNYLEPDTRFGKQYLNAIKEAIAEGNNYLE